MANTIEDEIASNGKNPEDVVSINEESTSTAAEAGVESASEPFDDTSEMPENQAKSARVETHEASPAPVGNPVVAKLAKRMQEIDRLHTEKELLQLNFVHKVAPKPYYVRWKQESNELFTLSVILRRRAKAIASKS